LLFNIDDKALVYLKHPEFDIKSKKSFHMNSHFLRKATILLSLSLVLSIAIGSTLSSINPRLSLLSNLFNQADLLPEFDFAPDNVCANQAISFTDKTTGTGPFTYEWDFGDGQKSILQNPVNTFSSAVGGNSRPFTVKLTVKAADGKTATKTKVVTVKEIPSLNITTSLLEQETDFEGLKHFIICESKPSEFTFVNRAGATEKNTLYQIDWGDGSPAFSGANWMELRHTYAVGIYNITYTVTPENGCKVSRKYGVFIGSNTAVGLGNPGNTNVCVGETLTFPITGTGNNPAGTKYTVTFSDGSAPQVFTHPAPASVSHTFTKNSCGTTLEPGFPNSFSVKIVSENPCSKSQASVVPIYVSEPPKPVIKAPTDPVCIDQDITFENITVFGTEVSNNGQCSQAGKFVWEISPATGWTLQGGTSLGTRPNPTSSNTWVSGSKNITPRFTTPGTYTVKLITGNRCGTKEEIKTICVIPKPVPSFTMEKTEACGPATIKATNTSNILGSCGTTNPNTFTWVVSYSKGTCGTSSDWVFTGGSNKNSESPSFLFKNPGIYTVRLTIAASCGPVIKEEKVTVTAPPSISITTIPNSCGPTILTPKATVNACDSGTPTYKWTFEGGVPATSTSLDPGPVTFSAPGTKKITLEVVSSCGTTAAEKTFTINELPIVNAGTDAEICNGEEIKLDGAASGGTGPFTYQWTSTPASSIPGSNTATPTVKPNQTTVYKLTVRNQTTSCLSTDEVEIKVIPAPIVQFDIPNQEICSGETTQVINITSSPLGESITWSSSANEVNGVSASGTNQIHAQTLINTTGKPVDVVYTALISNSSQGSCSVVPAKYTIRVNPEPSYTDDKLSVCSGQAFDFKPSNFTAGATFTWSVSAPSGITGATNSTQEATSIKQQLQNTTNAPLEVKYQILPFLGPCQGKQFELLVSVQPAPSINFSELDQIICTGSSSKAVLFSSDVAGASFTWIVDSKGANGVITSGSGNELPSQVLTNPTSQPITIEYKVSVSTNSGGSCSGAPKTYRITVNPILVISEKISDFNGFGISCAGANDGVIQVNPTGGNGVFSYSWNGPTGFTSSSKDLVNLKPGSYQVNISDQFGCSISKTYQLTESQPLIASVASTKNILCAGDESGTIEISVSGGLVSLPYQFEWKRNGIAFPSNSQNLSGIPAGTYEVKISDANGCFKIISGIKLTEPTAALVINYQKTDISCYGANDGSLDLDVSGGLPPYTITWSFGSNQSGFDNLGPGNYTLTVSDQSGCIRSQTITIDDAPLFKTEPEIKQISCFGKKDGFIKLNLQGGVGKTTIRWDNGAELENLFNLAAGFYGVTVKDETNCEIRSEFNIIEPALLQLESSLTDAVDCINPQSGAINLGISGGTPPYTIKWSNGQTSEDLTGITSGQYAIAITDASGCTITKAFEIKRPPVLLITAFLSTNVQCEPRVIEDKIKITLSGGIAPYDISWSGGTISSDRRTMTTTEPGFYEVTVVDGKGCVTTQSFDIENKETVAEADIESTAFDQYNSYLVNFEIQFWNRSFGDILTYYWDFGDGSESFEENPKHIYQAKGEYEITLIVTDVFGCAVEVKKKITVFDYYLVVPNIFSPNGDGINDYFFPRFVGIESLEFWILNKWGENIYYTDDLNSQGWDGKIYKETPIPGNYVYKLKFKTLDGRTQTITDLFMLLK
jgi:gliding motility-associated-like protein